MHDRGKVTPNLATRIVYRLAKIVAYAHRLNPPLVHRDLKPANILVRREEGNKLSLFIADFGIGGVAARQSLQEQARGPNVHRQTLPTAVRGAYTPLYASPQQVAGGPPDPRDDVHALGVIWFQLLTGDTRRGPAVDYAEELAELGVPVGQIGLLGRCVAPRAERRPANGGELAEGLELVLSPSTPSQPKEREPSDLSGTSERELAGETPRGPTVAPGAVTPSAGGRHATESLPGNSRFSDETTMALERDSAVAMTANVKLKDELQQLTADPRIMGLSLVSAELLPEDAVYLASCPILARITFLELTSNRLGPEGAAALATCPFLVNLNELRLFGCSIRDAGLAAVAESPHLRQLLRLDATSNQIGFDGVVALASSKLLSRLEYLRLGCNPIGDTGVKALANSPNVTRLRTLDLSGIRLGDVGASVLAASPNLISLAELWLHGTGIGIRGLRKLLIASHLVQLATLEIDDNDIGAKEAVELAAIPQLARLTTLSLRSNRFGPAGIEAIVSSPHVINLKRLFLHGCQLTDRGAKAVANSPYLAGLTVLNLDCNRITDAGAAAIAESPHLVHIPDLYMGQNKISAEGKRKLRERFGKRVRF